MNFKKISFILLFVIFTYYTTIFAATQQPELTSQSAILMSSTTGQILLNHNGDEKRSPAGLVKIIACLTAVEKNNINDIVEVQKSYSANDTNIGLKQGEQISLNWLLYASLIANANDATLTLAEYTSGSIDDFVSLMNERVKDIGCDNTNITNPTGNYDENQYTTAKDMALITKAAMENPHILTILKTAKITIPETNISESRFFRTSNHLISAFIENKYIYPNAQGGKTGLTNEDGYTLSTFAVKGEQRLIAIALGGSKKDNTIQTFIDATKLFNYGFSEFRLKAIANAGDILYELDLSNAKNTDFVTLVAETSLKALVDIEDKDPKFEKKFNIPKGISAPIKKGQEIGTVIYSYNGNNVGALNLVASSDVEPNLILNTHMFLGYIWSFSPIRYIVYVVIGIIILYLVTIPPLIKRAERKAKSRYIKRKKYDTIDK